MPTKYIERIEVISKTTGRRYLIDTLGCLPQDGYMYFQTENGTKRMKIDDILQINILEKKRHTAANIGGAVLGAGAGITSGLIARKVITYGLAATTPAGTAVTNILSTIFGFAIQAKSTPVFQNDISNFIDSGMRAYGKLGPAPVPDSELEDA